LKAGGNDFMLRPYVDEEFYCRVNQNLDTLDQIKSARRMIGNKVAAKVA
jgi:PleD family two-component response regulator